MDFGSPSGKVADRFGSSAVPKGYPMPAEGFTLAPELASTTYHLGDWPLSHVFLVDDRRFPWVMLVPRRAGVSEIIDLSPADRQQLFDEMMRASEALQAVAGPDKLNVGALGNMVRQLHVHVVARFVSDAAWPGPVWGNGVREPYPPHMVGPLMDRLKKALGLAG
jgi:diadenosine tetraphosphate (Ap4A) HIT family hydrolase